MDAAARFTKRMAEFGGHTRRCMAEHAAAGVALGGPALLDVVHRRRGLVTESPDEFGQDRPPWFCYFRLGNPIKSLG
jgi:hypothetical protein